MSKNKFYDLRSQTAFKSSYLFRIVIFVVFFFFNLVPSILNLFLGRKVVSMTYHMAQFQLKILHTQFLIIFNSIFTERRLTASTLIIYIIAHCLELRTPNPPPTNLQPHINPIQPSSSNRQIHQFRDIHTDMHTYNKLLYTCKILYKYSTSHDTRHLSQF